MSKTIYVQIKYDGLVNGILYRDLQRETLKYQGYDTNQWIYNISPTWGFRTINGETICHNIAKYSLGFASSTRPAVINKIGPDGTGSTLEWRSVTVADDFSIPWRDDSTGLVGAGFLSPEKTSFGFDNVKFDLRQDVVGGVSFGDFSLNTKDNFFTIAQNAATAAGLSNFATAIGNAGVVRGALENVVGGGLNLFEAGFNNFDNPNFNPADFDRQVDAYLRGAQDTATQALIDVNMFPNNPAAEAVADRILGDARLVGIAIRDGSIPVSAGVQLGLQVSVGGVTLSTTWTGTVSTDVVFDGNASSTLRGGDGNDALSGGGGDDVIFGDQGNDYINGGSGSDTLDGGGGLNYLNGGSGDDTLKGVVGRANSNGGQSTLIGGAGRDTAEFATSFGAAHVSRTRSASSDGYVSAGDLIVSSGGARDIVSSSVEVLRFTDGTVRLDHGMPLFDALHYSRRYEDVYKAGADAASHYNGNGWKEGRDPNPLFDTSRYLAAQSDVRSAGINPLLHYEVAGWKENRDPALEFDTEIYLTLNPDVRAAGINPLLHYLSAGQAEGRPTSAVVGRGIVGGFDRDYYLMRYEDVARAGVDPLKHFVTTGWKEGRDPNAYFSTNYYLERNKDVAAAGIDPLGHYMAVGWKEGRDPSASFDTTAYLDRNGDVKAAGINALGHFLDAGVYEGRKAPLADADVVAPLFDAGFYLQTNPDVVGRDPLLHFLSNGWKEGRNPNSLFDTRWYLQQNPDVVAAKMNPLAHYAQIGWKEGRDPSKQFDTSDYLAANPDVASSGANPLLHFIRTGEAADRSTGPLRMGDAVVGSVRGATDTDIITLAGVEAGGRHVVVASGANVMLSLVRADGTIANRSVEINGKEYLTFSAFFGSGAQYKVVVEPQSADALGLYQLEAAHTTYAPLTTLTPSTDPGATAATALNLGAMSAASTDVKVLERITSGDRDFFRFDLQHATQLDIYLGGLTGDLNLRLLRSDGSSVSSTNFANSSYDRLAADVGAGTYLVEVFGAGTAQSSYEMFVYA